MTYLAKEVFFYQDDGYRLAGDLYTRASGKPSAALVFCHGYGATKQLIAPDLAAGLLDLTNVAVLAFDYSGFGASEGPRERLDPTRQVRDIRAAVSWLTEEFQGVQIVLFGISFGGAVALDAACRDDRVSALIDIALFSSGEQWMRDLRPNWQWVEFQEAIAQDRKERVRSGISKKVHPDWIMPRDPEAAAFNKMQLEAHPERSFQLDVVSAGLIVEYDPLSHAHKLRGRPAVFLHCGRDLLMPIAYAEHAAEQTGGDLIILDGLGHHEVYSGEPRNRALKAIADWLQKNVLEEPSGDN
jgi:pimeloyl-ACP methyl ester carboxylesterase